MKKHCDKYFLDLNREKENEFNKLNNNKLILLLFLIEQFYSFYE